MATTEKGIYYPNDYSEAADIPADMQTMAESVDTAIGNTEDTIGGEISTLQQTVQTNTQDISDIQTEQTTQNTNIQTNTNNVTALQTTVSYLEGLIPTDTASGEEITLTDSVRYPFKEFNVGGNTKQQSYTGKNLVNVFVTPTALSGTTLPTYSISEDGYVSYNNANGQYKSMMFNTFEVEPSTKYYSYADVVSTTGTPTIYITELDENNTNLGAIYPKNAVFTTKANTKYLRYGITTEALHTAGVFTIRPMIVKSTTADNDYEPYVGGTASPNPSYPQEIENVSGEVEVKVENKNLCTNEAIGMNSAVLSNIPDNYIGPVTIAVKTTSGTAQVNYRINYEDGTNYNNYVITFNQANGAWRVAKYTTTKAIKSIGLYWISATAGATQRVPEHIMFLKGTYNTITDADYEPHEEQTATFPLAEGQVLHLEDTLEDDGIHVTQRDFEFTQTVIDNDITIEAQAQGTNTYRIKMGNSYAPILINDNITTIKSSHFKGIPRNDRTIAENNLIYGDVTENKCFFIIRNTEFASENALKTFLENQYTNGNPVRIQYLRATPVVIPYTAEQQTAYDSLKNLYSYKGTTYISSTNEPSPVFEVEYRKSNESL